MFMAEEREPPPFENVPAEAEIPDWDEEWEDVEDERMERFFSQP